MVRAAIHIKCNKLVYFMCCGISNSQDLSMKSSFHKKKARCLENLFQSYPRGWIGQGRMALNWDRGGLDWILEGSFSVRGWWHTGTGCPGRLWMPHPWRHSRPGWMWLWAAWSMVGDPAHSKGVETRRSLWSFSTQAILWFYDSKNNWFYQDKWNLCQ